MNPISSSRSNRQHLNETMQETCVENSSQQTCDRDAYSQQTCEDLKQSNVKVNTRTHKIDILDKKEKNYTGQSVDFSVAERTK